MKMVFAAATLLLATSAAAQTYTAENGGLKDPSSGLVWGESTVTTTNGWVSWNFGYDWIQAYSVTGSDGTVYDDWRMPTVGEMQALIADNPQLLEDLVPTNVSDDPKINGRPWYGETDVWTGDAKGAYVYVVHVKFVEEFDADGNFVRFYLDQAASGQAKWIRKDSWVTECYPVRNPNAISGGPRGGKK